MKLHFKIKDRLLNLQNNPEAKLKGFETFDLSVKGLIKVTLDEMHPSCKRSLAKIEECLTTAVHF